MLSISEVNELLDEIVEQLPQEIFADLNGGVSLLPDTKRSAADPDGGLYVLGEYCRDQMGRYIVLYYGSICIVHGMEGKGQLRESLRKIVSHELTHHLESLAGERDLEVQDEIDIDEYLNR